MMIGLRDGLAEIDKQTDRQAGRQADRQTNIQIDNNRKTLEGQINRQKEKRRTGRQRPMDRLTDRQR